jgi:membrane protease YdiL (CAAX protease family)
MLTRFFLIAFALCWLITIPIALQVQGATSLRLLPAPVQWLIGVVPFIAAGWVTRNSDQRASWLANALRFRVPAGWYVLGLLLPWAILGVAFAARSVSGQPLPHISFSPQLAVFGLIWLLLAFGEEAGWRAFALPQLLRRHNFWVAATLLGVFWCVWHYPKMFSSPYLHPDEEGLRILAQFSIQIVIANYLICWLYLRTQSAIITSVFHMSWNLVSTVYWQGSIDPYVTLTLAGVTLAVVLLDRRTLIARVAPGPA